jgi:hypothetical protein
MAVNKMAITSTGIAVGSQAGALSASAYLHIMAGTTALSPFRLTSGSLRTTAQVGDIEFLTDKLYLTITTGAVRKELTLNDSSLADGYMPVANSNGRLQNGFLLPIMSAYIPTLTEIVNLPDYGIGTAIYLKMGQWVTVSGGLTIMPSAASVVEFYISLPIPSVFYDIGSLSGNAICVYGGDPYVGQIVADTVGGRALCLIQITSTDELYFSYTFTYIIED